MTFVASVSSFDYTFPQIAEICLSSLTENFFLPHCAVSQSVDGLLEVFDHAIAYFLHVPIATAWPLCSIAS
jgi:hypothetical protein